MTKVYRFTIAKATPKGFAEQAQNASLSGTITESLGFGEWGLEEGITVEMSGDSKEILSFFAHMVDVWGQECVYFTIDGKSPRLLWSGGRIEEL